MHYLEVRNSLFVISLTSNTYFLFYIQFNRAIDMLRKLLNKPLILMVFSSSLLMITVQAAEVTREQIKGIDEQVQDIKKDVLSLTTELANLEEKLLFPSNTQISVFVSTTNNKDFELDGMQIKIDNKVVAQHAYTMKELDALRAGGVQRIYTGNVKTGSHNLEVSFIGREASDDEYKRSKVFKVVKKVGPKFVEIQIAGSSASNQTVSLKDW